MKDYDLTIGKSLQNGVWYLQMLLQKYDRILELILDESIREESIGDLWESDYVLKSKGISSIRRNLIIFWRFLLLIKVSIEMAIEKITTDDHEVVYASGFGYKSELESFYERNDISPSTINYLRHYCNNSYTNRSGFSISQRQIYDSKFNPGDLQIREVQFWVEQADKLMRECRISTGYRGNCEAVINSLLLSNLVRKLDSYSPKPISSGTFRKFIEQINISDEFISQYVGFSSTSYIRRLIVQTSSLCVYVISWEPGQKSSLHHHGSALDAIKVIQGEMSHWITEPEREIPYEGYESKEEKIDLGAPTRHSEGDLVIIDRRHGHQIANLSSERLVTLNIRFGNPPEPEDECWQTPDNTSKFVWKQIDFVWNQGRTEKTINKK